MSDIITTRNPDLIAAEINAIKRSTAKYVLEQSIEIGRLLVEAKEAVPYGSWGTWLETNCEYSTTNANNLMRIYTEYGSDAQINFFEDNRLELYGNLNRSQAIALLSLPRAERDDFVRENDVPAMSVSELEERIKAAKAEAALEAEEKYKSETAKLREAAEKAEKKSKAAAADAEKAKKALKVSTEQRVEIAAQRDKYADELHEAQLKLDEAAKKTAEITPEQRENIIAEANLRTAEKTAALEAEITRLKAAANITVQKCAVYFEQIQSGYAAFVRTLAAEEDETVKDKLRAAFKVLLGKMEG